MEVGSRGLREVGVAGGNQLAAMSKGRGRRVRRTALQGRWSCHDGAMALPGTHPFCFMPELAFFPAMKPGTARKLELLSRVQRKLQARYTVTSLGAQAGRLSVSSSLAVDPPGKLNLNA